MKCTIRTAAVEDGATQATFCKIPLLRLYLKEGCWHFMEKDRLCSCRKSMGGILCDRAVANSDQVA